MARKAGVGVIGVRYSEVSVLQWERSKKARCVGSRRREGSQKGGGGRSTYRGESRFVRSVLALGMLTLVSSRPKVSLR